MTILLKMCAWFLLFILLIMGLMMIPSPQEDAPKPWEITQNREGTVTVFGIHLGTTTYAQVQQLWQEAGETAIFATTEQPLSAEVFFDRINLSGLSARAVLTLDMEQGLLETMRNRAMTARLQPSGARRYEPSISDHQHFLAAKVYAITYVPSIRLEEDMLLSRFGYPESKQKDPLDAQAIIWHYPHSGLTIRLHEKDRAVFTYQNP